MGVYGGNYKGNYAEYEPTLISGSANKLWLDLTSYRSFAQSSGVLYNWYNLAQEYYTYYESDFSAGKDSWWIAGGVSDTITGNIDGINGKNNWLEYDDGTDVAITHRTGQINEGDPVKNRLWKVTYRIFRPTDSEISGYSINSVISSGAPSYYIDPGEEIYTTAYVNATTSDDLAFIFFSGSDGTYDGNNNKIYIKDVKWELRDAFYQTNSSAKPSYISGSVVFDGVQEFLDGTNILPNFTGSEDIQGDIFFVAEKVTSGISLLAMADDSQDNERIHVDINSNDKLGYTTVGSPLSTNVPVTDNVVSGKSILEVSSEGTLIRLDINGNEEGTSGANDGDWFGDSSGMNTFSIGSLQRLSPIYANANIHEIIYFNRQLKPKERAMVFKMLNSKHNVY